MSADGLQATCLGPLPVADFEHPAFTAPRGSCDTHAHVIARSPAYPLAATRSYTPPAASVGDYRAMLAAAGMERGVLVQVSVHGTDNRLMLEALKAYPDTLRGVAVVDADIDDASLDEMHAAGVRGARFNLLFGGGVSLDALESLDRRLAQRGWHLEFLLDGRTLPDMRDRLMRLHCSVVIDHMGHMPAADGADSAGFITLCDLARNHGWWVKLSGPYRLSERREARFFDVLPMARALVDAAPDRMLYGSDWPHVDQHYPVDTGVMRNQLAGWVPSQAVRHRILVDNPAQLYGFPVMP
ncbi:amidohydrolase family protein [Salinisphaera sp. SWV1]|uniref:amidohydrolase family protein n=1 Tax=Salinisphaera sp. SWV1 TaxID=3454139 RepID=UPI003F8594E9